MHWDHSPQQHSGTDPLLQSPHCRCLRCEEMLTVKSLSAASPCIPLSSALVGCFHPSLPALDTGCGTGTATPAGPQQHIRCLCPALHRHYLRACVNTGNVVIFQKIVLFCKRSSVRQGRADGDTEGHSKECCPCTVSAHHPHYRWSKTSSWKHWRAMKRAC